MFRIRRIYDDVLPANREALRQVKEILRTRFPELDESEIHQIGQKLRNPFKQRFRTVFFVQENMVRKVRGFAALLHEPEIGFCFLDWIATLKGKASGGIGGALYEKVREEASALGVEGLFFECLPDEVELCTDQELLKENRARLRFYERYGARPIVGTAYETPVKEGDTCMPFLVLDGLDRSRMPGADFMKKVVRAILERKYPQYCPPEYVERVVSSFQETPIRLRDFRYVKPAAVRTRVESRAMELIALIVNERHEIHHVHERGYVESPVRVRSILSHLEKSGLFTPIKTRWFPDRHIHAVHDGDFVNYIRRACGNTEEGKSLYPYIFPIRNKTRPPKDSSVLPGYYCIDTFTPINRNAYPAARSGVDCALTAAQEIIEGRRIAYALVRPPGHHAECRAFGGFCYLNNNAVAAHYLSAYGRVAILDVDYHHGNGQQDIFYRRSDVLTVSIHGHPRFAYPYFSGFEDEHGEGDGEGFNLNFPLPEDVEGLRYRKALKKTLERIDDFEPEFLVVALGLDTAKNDPTGTWSLLSEDFDKNGRMIGELGLPTVVIQEGGYRTRTLGVNARSFFNGLIVANPRAAGSRRDGLDRLHGISFRHEIHEQDAERIRRLLELTGFFRSDEIMIAVELLQERVANGDESGYHFIFAEHYGRLVGYICYGPIPITLSSYDVYWVAVHPDLQGRGVGKELLQRAEKLMREREAARIYVETSTRLQYASTRAFYEHCGYRLESVMDDFYAPGEGKATYCKSFVRTTSPTGTARTD